MPRWYNPSQPTAVAELTTSHAMLPILDPQFLSSRYFLGITRQSTGDLNVRDGEMSLRIEAPNQMILTQAGMFMPLEAPDDVFATWQFRWAHLSEHEIRQLQLATETGLFTIDDPILASCTGYIANLAFEALPGYVTDEGHNIYSATVEFAVTRLQWPAILGIPADGVYPGGHGFGADFSGAFPLVAATNGITVADAWFECRADPLQHLYLMGQSFRHEAGTFVAVLQHYDDTGWVIGDAGSTAHSLFTASPQASGDGMSIHFLGDVLVAENVLPIDPAVRTFQLNVSSLVDMPSGSHFLVAVGYRRKPVTAGLAGDPSEGYQFTMGVTAWHPETAPLVVFGNFGSDTGIVHNTGFIEGTINVGGSRQASPNTALDARLRPVNNRFFYNIPLTRGLMASLMGSYLHRHDFDLGEEEIGAG